MDKGPWEYEVIIEVYLIVRGGPNLIRTIKHTCPTISEAQQFVQQRC